MRCQSLILGLLVLSSITSGCVEETFSEVSGITELQFENPSTSLLETEDSLHEKIVFNSGVFLDEEKLEYNWTLFSIENNWSIIEQTNSSEILQPISAGGWILSVYILNDGEKITEEISKEIYKISGNTTASGNFDCQTSGTGIRFFVFMFLNVHVRESLTINYTIESNLPADPLSKLHFYLPFQGGGVILDERRGAGIGSWTFTGDQLNDLGMNDGTYHLQLELTVESEIELTSFSKCSVETFSNYVWDE